VNVWAGGMVGIIGARSLCLSAQHLADVGCELGGRCSPHTALAYHCTACVEAGGVRLSPLCNEIGTTREVEIREEAAGVCMVEGFLGC
jgi:hypothetical protein